MRPVTAGRRANACAAHNAYGYDPAVREGIAMRKALTPIAKLPHWSGRLRWRWDGNPMAQYLLGDHEALDRSEAESEAGFVDMKGERRGKVRVKPSDPVKARRNAELAKRRMAKRLRRS